MIVRVGGMGGLASTQVVDGPSKAEPPSFGYRSPFAGVDREVLRRVLTGSGSGAHERFARRIEPVTEGVRVVEPFPPRACEECGTVFVPSTFTETGRRRPEHGVPLTCSQRCRDRRKIRRRAEHAAGGSGGV